MCLQPVLEAKPSYSCDVAEKSGVWSLNPRDEASVPAPCTLTHGAGLCEQPVHNSQSPITVARRNLCSSGSLAGTSEPLPGNTCRNDGK